MSGTQVWSNIDPPINLNGKQLTRKQCLCHLGRTINPILRQKQRRILHTRHSVHTTHLVEHSLTLAIRSINLQIH
jgi:hypothetical protein